MATEYKFRPGGLQAILTGRTGHYDAVLELIGLRIKDVIGKNLSVEYPPVGIRPHPAKRTGRLKDSITPGVTYEGGRLVGYVVADIEHAWYAHRLRETLGYDIITQQEVDSLEFGRI